MYVYKIIESPVGELKLIGSERGLTALLWGRNDSKRVFIAECNEAINHAVFLEAEKQLYQYFRGELHQFTLPLDFIGTEFQKKVWHALKTIPFGETRSYRDIAQQIGNPKAVRAVGAANGRNPISIIIPCHRVIGANGTLTGFAGGLDIKAYLLNLEAKNVPLNP
jgi:methylated-DNA-[protein]-cysteine S-methyltransferase